MIRSIDLNDLLPRRSVVRDRTAVSQMLDGKRIVVTGAGGSIGSELARQINQYKPRELVLVDNCEFNLYSISEQIPTAKAVYADIRDSDSVNTFMRSNLEQVVFHAAAMKHVPLVENNRGEALKTNVVGTANVAAACDQNFVYRLVLISTDKAVNPSSFMGETKRTAEIICKNRTVVRFGNVLGSSGSVVPLFKRQLIKGGPLTVTHEDMERYFMSIDEAVELVLQAATGEPATYILDMGQPVKIMDLARDMIRLSGKMPDDEIKIEVTGLRPGERLTEELFYNTEVVNPSGMDGIWRVSSGA
jgi:FlaA1/EpsC-like NDP-sugar epimerase